MLDRVLRYVYVPSIEIDVEFLHRQVSRSLSQSPPGGCSFVSYIQSINQLNQLPNS